MNTDTEKQTQRPLPVEPVKLEPKWGPLGPDDVPPGSVIRHPATMADSSWASVTIVTDKALAIYKNELQFGFLFENDWQILRPGQTEWQLCRKEVQA